jgi:hypothetical protein
LANTPQPNLQDILSNAARLAPTGAWLYPSPDGASAPQSTAPKPSLGTEDQLQAPADVSQPDSNSNEVAPSSILLPPRDRSNESAPAEEQQPSFIQKLGRIAGGAIGVESPDSSPQAKAGAIGMKLLSGLGTAGAMAVGTPVQKQIAEENLQLPLKQQALRNEAIYRGIMGGAAQQRANAAQENASTGAYKAQGQYGTGENGSPLGTSRESAAASMARAAAAQQMADEHTKQIEASLQGMNYVDPNLAHAIGRDDIAGKNISPLAYQQQVANVVKSRGFHTIDTGKDGPENGQWVVDNVGRKIYQISPFSPVNARGAAYGANRPVQALDPTDNTVKWMTAGNAEAAGAAPAGPGQQIMSKQAQFKDIYSGIGSMRQAIHEMGTAPLDTPTIAKLTLASRETDPTVYHNAVDTILGTEQLTPAQQDFVIALQQLNERVLSLRNLAGMGNASDSLRGAIRATLPSLKSGNPQMMTKQLDAVTNLVDNLYTGVPSVKTNGTPNTPTKPNAASAKTTPQNSIPEGQTATGPNGHKIVMSGGRWLDAATKQPI